MRTISLWQPWASLMADGRKLWETRHWKGSDLLLGREIAIHAAQKVDKVACVDFGYDPDRIARGAVVSTHVLEQYLQFTEENVRGIKDDYGDFYPGRWGWKLRLVRKFEEPITATGHQGIWEWTPPWENYLRF